VHDEVLDQKEDNKEQIRCKEEIMHPKMYRSKIQQSEVSEVMETENFLPLRHYLMLTCFRRVKIENESKRSKKLYVRITFSLLATRYKLLRHISFIKVLVKYIVKIQYCAISKTLLATIMK
jgi:hypothetical protein